jgi:hypothetical protein
MGIAESYQLTAFSFQVSANSIQLSAFNFLPYGFGEGGGSGLAFRHSNAGFCFVV